MQLSVLLPVLTPSQECAAACLADRHEAAREFRIKPCWCGHDLAARWPSVGTAAATPERTTDAATALTMFVDTSYAECKQSSTMRFGTHQPCYSGSQMT